MKNGITTTINTKKSCGDDPSSAYKRIQNAVLAHSPRRDVRRDPACLTARHLDK